MDSGPRGEAFGFLLPVSVVKSQPMDVGSRDELTSWVQFPYPLAGSRWHLLREGRRQGPCRRAVGARHVSRADHGARRRRAEVEFLQRPGSGRSQRRLPTAFQNATCAQRPLLGDSVEEVRLLSRRPLIAARTGHLSGRCYILVDGTVAACGGSPFSPSTPFCRLASALIRLASTAKPSPPTRPSSM
jgi:hypothetical protein